MTSEDQTLGLLRSLQGLAQANLAALREHPELVSAYRSAKLFGRYKYESDQLTCERPDCWSTLRGLLERYAIGPVLGDCEDFACAEAAYLAFEGQPALIGLRPGRRIAHAVCGIETPGGDAYRIGLPDHVIDPSVDFGMPRLPRYDQIYWMRV